MSFHITTTQEISPQEMQDLLCCAFEGGIGYWATITGYEWPKDIPRDQLRDWPYSKLPLYEGGGVKLEDAEVHQSYCPCAPEDAAFQPTILTREKLQHGLNVLTEKYPHHARDIVHDTMDADTGDALVQCALFGEIVFG